MCSTTVVREQDCKRLLLYSLHLASFLFFSPPTFKWASLVAQTVKHLPAMWETQVQPLGEEDPLEMEMATHSSTLSCLENPMDRGAW